MKEERKRTKRRTKFSKGGFIMAKNKIAYRKYSITSSLLLFIGVAIILYNPIMNYWVIPKHLTKIHKTNLGAERIKQNRIALESKSVEMTDWKFDFSKVENLSSLDARALIQTEYVIGGIYIPSVAITLPILFGATNENLKAASATLKPDQVMGKGNYAIAAHNSRNPDVLFGSLRKVEVGDEIYISDKDKVYKYVMVQREVVMPERIDVIDDVENKTLTTLISCYSWDGSDRLIVTGELEEVMDYVDAQQEVYKAFEPL